MKYIEIVCACTAENTFSFSMNERLVCISVRSIVKKIAAIKNTSYHGRDIFAGNAVALTSFLQSSSAGGKATSFSS